MGRLVLCIRNNALIFIHCKAGKKTRGASSFHEVVSQGLKNLGRVQGTPTQFEKKLGTVQRKYWSGTKINRLRTVGATWADFLSAASNILPDPTASKEVHLVVTMLSKAKFEDAARTTPPYFIQLIWLLSAFINCIFPGLVQSNHSK